MYTHACRHTHTHTLTFISTQEKVWRNTHKTVTRPLSRNSSSPMERPPSSNPQVLGLAVEGPLQDASCCNNRGPSGQPTLSGWCPSAGQQHHQSSWKCPLTWPATSRLTQCPRPRPRRQAGPLLSSNERVFIIVVGLMLIPKRPNQQVIRPHGNDQKPQL